MFTTEITVILPIVLIMILCIMVFGFFIVQLNLTALSTERAFVMQVCEDMVLNGAGAKKSEDLKVINRGVWTRFDINYGRVIGNPFQELMKKDIFEFAFSHTLMRLNSPVLKLILLGGEKIFEIE